MLIFAGNNLSLVITLMATNSETHPLPPFLPREAKVLVLGSFPPPKKRWCMEFFYPNWTNDFWRIWGYIAKGDKDYFVAPGEKRFDRDKIVAFCEECGLALYDTAEEVVRLKDNASDNFLRVVRPTDIVRVLESLPCCHTIVATGQKSADTLAASLGCVSPAVGECVETLCAGRAMKIWRMPSTSRAYPRPIEWKAEYYRKIFSEITKH